MLKVRKGGGEEIPLAQGKEQWLCFAGAAVKRPRALSQEHKTATCHTVHPQPGPSHQCLVDRSQRPGRLSILCSLCPPPAGG